MKTVQETPMRGCRCEECDNFGRSRQSLIGLGVKGIPLNHSAALEKTWCKFRTEETDEMDIRNPKKRDEFPQRKCVERKCTNCGVTETFKEKILSDNRERLAELSNITWSQWGKVRYVTTSGEDSTKLRFVEYRGSATTLLTTYFTQLNSISEHHFMKLWQRRNFTWSLRHLQRGQVLFVQDFQMNMLLYMQDEPPAIHWDHSQATVHPTSVFYVCPNRMCKKKVREDLIHISPDKTHDKYAVKRFFDTCLGHLRTKNVPMEEFLIFTDNCVGQYKSKFVFYWMTQLKTPCTHHFFAPKHGKGPSDRAGGAFKKKMRNYVKSKGLLITTEQIERYCRTNYDHQVQCGDEVRDGTDRQDPRKGAHSLVKVFNHPEISRSIKIGKLRGVPGTRSYLHGIRNTGIEGVLQYRHFDCCCFGCVTHSSACSQKEYADEWMLASVLFKHKNKFLKTLQLPNWFKPMCNGHVETIGDDVGGSDEEHVDVTEEIRDEVGGSDEEHADESSDEEIDEMHVVDDASDDEDMDESELSGVEPLEEEEDVLITGIDEYVTSSEDEYDQISVPDNETSAHEIELDESVEFNWKQILDQMKDFETYEELKTFVLEKNSSIPTPTLKIKYYLDSEDQLCEIANKYRPRGMPKNLVPVFTIGDGNCLPHALANVLLSDQRRSDEIRVRITFVAVLHEDNFVTHQSLTRGCPRGTSNRHHSYTLYSGSELAATDEINDRIVRDVYRSDVLANSKDGNFMGMWQFHHAAEAYKRPISSIYPQHTNRTLRSDLNRIILPLSPVHDNKTPVSIMWSPLHEDAGHCNVKHFVAVLKVIVYTFIGDSNISSCKDHASAFLFLYFPFPLQLK